MPASNISSSRFWTATILGFPLLLLAGAPAQAQPAQVADPMKNMRLVTDEMLLHPDPGDWLMWRRTYDGFGFSPLNQINKANVKDLQVAWAWSLTNGATESTPIVHDGILYIWNYADKVQALNAATGDLIWEYRRELPQAIIDLAGNIMAKRNMAIYQDKLVIATSDAHLVALDAKTGDVVWDHETADWHKGWRYTSGPFIVDGMVLQGMTGCGNAEPGGCFITAHDFKTGDEKWRVWTIAHPDDPNFNTWNGLPLESRFGASAWVAGSFDPDQNLVFYGVGQPYPWIAEMRGTLPKKKNAPSITNTSLYSDSTLAIDPATGKVKWYHQYLQDDTWDLDYVYERMLIDLPLNGATRKMVVTTGKLGIIEALDRTTGEWLWAKQTVPQNVVAKIDDKTGEKTINQAAIPHIGQTTVNCPADPGGRGWPATAYNPTTQTLFLPLNEFCSNTTPTPLDPGQAYTGGGRAIFARMLVPNSDGNVGRIDAIKLTDRSTTWSFRTRAPSTGAVLPTAGGVVFAGAWDRYFRAWDDATGKVLWQIRTNNAINGFPVSYSVNGKQYVAVSVGNGSSHAKSLATLTPEITAPDGGSVLWVFALPDTK
ncbi:MAG TPA: PQQ-binding-like beta-propeller repeat protein [Acetobacteraceae bacterium]|nr:PQQ-binding-like beta-propeller repeat protein [Acetobacteraceae bacterium]